MSFRRCAVVYVRVCVCVSLTNWDRFLNSFQLSGTQTVLMLITHSPAHTTAPGGRNDILLSTESSLRCVFTLHVCCDSRLPFLPHAHPPNPLPSVCFHVWMLPLHVCREKLLLLLLLHLHTSPRTSQKYRFCSDVNTGVLELYWKQVGALQGELGLMISHYSTKLPIRLHLAGLTITRSDVFSVVTPFGDAWRVANSLFGEKKNEIVICNCKRKYIWWNKIRGCVKVVCQF